jgi:hypothetical protein
VRASRFGLLACWLLACGSNAVGTVCSDTQPCAMPLVCVVSDDPAVNRCMRLCDVFPDGGNARLCSDGSACIAMDGMRVCYVGGHTPYGTACMGALACEPGTICSPDLMMCEQVCTAGEAHSPCAETETCVDVAGGLCRAPTP